MHKPELVILVGMIASGKSTFAKELAKQGYVIINDDDIVNMIHGQDYTLYEKDLKPLYKSVAVTTAMTALSMGRSVVVDRGVNIRKKARAVWTALANTFDVDCVAQVFKKDNPLVHAKRRFNHDWRGLSHEKWIEVAIRHDREWQNPHMDEGFKLIVQCHHNGADIHNCLKPGAA
jgi:predicted kinase